MTNKHVSQRRALIIGINDYPNCRPQDQLKGAINDAHIWQDLLYTRFAFPEEGVLLLENASRAQILDAFETHLIAPAGAGDLIVFAFSGHGSYTWDLEGDEPDGYDETLVPSDGHLDPTREPRHITDDEIFELNCRLQKRIGPTGFVVYLIDSCHSGSITRGVGRARFMEPELPPRESLPPQTKFGPGLRQLGKGTYHTWLPDKRSYALLAACRDDEQAREGEDSYGNTMGHFTRALTWALQQVSQPGQGTTRPVTYLDVLDMASPRVRRYNPNQTPQLEGDSSRAIFGLERFDQEPYLPVQDVEANGVILGGGSAHLVTQGSLFAIHTATTRSLTEARAAGESPLAQVKVAEVEATSSRALYDPARPTGRVKAGHRAFKLRHNYEGMQCPVAVVGVPPYDSAAQAVLGQSPLLQMVALDRAPRLVIWALRPGAAPNVQQHLTVPRGLENGPSFVITDIGGETLLRPTPSGTDEHLRILRQNVERIAQHLNLLALQNENPEAILRGKVQLALKRLEQQGDRYVAVGPEFDDQPIFTEGDLIALEITNQHEEPIYFSLFDLGLSWTISLLYPLGQESNKLAPRRPFIVGLRPPGIPLFDAAVIPEQFPTERAFGRETFKVLLTTRPASFGWLAQPGVEVPSWRMVDPLAELLALARAGRTPEGLTFRGDDFSTPDSQSWFTEQVDFVLKRKDSVV